MENQRAKYLPLFSTARSPHPLVDGGDSAESLASSGVTWAVPLGDLSQCGALVIPGLDHPILELVEAACFASKDSSEGARF